MFFVTVCPLIMIHVLYDLLLWSFLPCSLRVLCIYGSQFSLWMATVETVWIQIGSLTVSLLLVLSNV